MKIPDLHLAYPSRSAGAELKKRITRHLVESDFSAGDVLPTDFELVEATGLSRSTVRRTLDILQKEGWIERFPGRGTFVGPRLLILDEGDSTESQKPTKNATRVGLVVSYTGQSQLDWYTPHIVQGFSDVAESCPLAVELLGHRDNDVDSISKRLRLSRPHVLAVLNGLSSSMWLIRDAQRMGIPVVCAGTPYRGLELPAAMEDNVQGMQLAVKHLFDAGHRQIGLLSDRQSGPWIIERHQSFASAHINLGLPYTEANVHWIPWLADVSDRRPVADGVLSFIRRSGVSAVVCGGSNGTQLIGDLVQSNQISVPDELSVVSFDQHHLGSEWLGVEPCTINIPLREMGVWLAKASVELHQDREVHPGCKVVACSLTKGQSVRVISAS